MECLGFGSDHSTVWPERGRRCAHSAGGRNSVNYCCTAVAWPKLVNQNRAEIDFLPSFGAETVCIDDIRSVDLIQTNGGDCEKI